MSQLRKGFPSTIPSTSFYPFSLASSAEMHVIDIDGTQMHVFLVIPGPFKDVIWRLLPFCHLMLLVNVAWHGTACWTETLLELKLDWESSCLYFSRSHNKSNETYWKLTKNGEENKCSLQNWDTACAFVWTASIKYQTLQTNSERRCFKAEMIHRMFLKWRDVGDGWYLWGGSAATVGGQNDAWLLGWSLSSSLLSDVSGEFTVHANISIVTMHVFM